MSKAQWSSGNHPAKRTTVPSTTTGADPIATGLQQLFAPLAAEAIPDEFMALLEQIDAKSRAADAAGQSRAADAASQSHPAGGEVRTGTGAAK